MYEIGPDPKLRGANEAVTTDVAKTCFVIMPFSDATKPKMKAEEWDEVFNATFFPAFEELGYVCTRSKPLPGNFLREIITALNSADIVLADLTGQKPNVLYELGIRHSLRRGTILAAQSEETILSDLRNYWHLFYGWKTQRQRDAFKKEIKRIITEMNEKPDRPDSPIVDFLGEASLYGSMISIVPGETTFFGVEENDPRALGAFATIRIINHGPYIPRSQGFLKFYRLDGSLVFPEEMRVRWSSAPEPLTLLAVTNSGETQVRSYPDFTKVTFGYVADLASKEVDSLAPAVKFADGTCWGWTPDSYFHGWKHPSWQLPSEQLIVEIRVIANGREYIERLSLDTSMPWQDFAVHKL